LRMVAGCRVTRLVVAVWLSSLTKVAGQGQRCLSGPVCSGQGPDQQSSHTCGGSTEYCCELCPDHSQIPGVSFPQGCTEPVACQCSPCADTPGTETATPITVSAILSAVSSSPDQSQASGTVSVQGDLNLLIVTYAASAMPPNTNGTIQIHEGSSCNDLRADYITKQSSSVKSGSASWTTAQNGDIQASLLTVDVGLSVNGVVGKAVTLEEAAEGQGGSPGLAVKICGILTSSADNSSSGLDGWQIGLIVVCCCLALCVVALIVALVCVVRKRARHAEGQGVEDGVILADFKEDNAARETMRSSEVALSDTDNALDKVRASLEIPAYTLPPANIANPTMPAVKIAPPTPKGPTPRPSAEFGAQSMSPNSTHDVSSYDDQPSIPDHAGDSIKM